MMYGWVGSGWVGWIMMTVLLVLFWAAVITAIVLAIRYLSASGQRNQPTGRAARTAEGVLADRFARGDIDEDDYRRKMTALREHRSP